MSTRKFAALFFAIFFLGALPLILVQPSGSASAGLSAGFATPIHSLYHLFLFVAIGVCAAYLGEESLVMLPLTFVLMLLIGAIVELDPKLYPVLRLFMLGAILLFAISVSVVTNKWFLLAVTVFSSIGFHLGTSYMTMVPVIASPLYYLLGMIISVILISSIGVSLGLTLRESLISFFYKKKSQPAAVEIIPSSSIF